MIVSTEVEILFYLCFTAFFLYLVIRDRRKKTRIASKK